MKENPGSHRRKRKCNDVPPPKYHNTNPSRLHALIELTTRIWLDRNVRVFQDRSTNTPLIVSLVEASRTVEADMSIDDKVDRWIRGQEGLETIKTWIEVQESLAATTRRSHEELVRELLENEEVIVVNSQRSEEKIVLGTNSHSVHE
ncbi:hypothetical protein R1flu_012754 [Riccia fluitans]|uniref:Uncharacterized protein n=1 Tax=Riccia fluitans TaxID=41844 RepID=A0ABD1ZFL4_9MARC